MADKSVLGTELLFLAAKIFAIVVLLQVGGVAPILAAILLLINAIFSTAIVFATLVANNKKEESK